MTLLTRRAHLGWLMAAGGALAVAGAGRPARAQPVLEKPIHLIVPFAAGGATDAIARVIGKRVGEVTAQALIVENKPGAGGTIGIDLVARAAPDSNTLVLVNALQHTSSVKLYPNLKYKAIESFRPLAAIGSVRYMLLVNPGFDAADYAGFVRRVRSEPGTYSYGSAGIGSAPHLVMELFARSEGLSMVHVPYGGSAPAMNDLVAGHVQVAMDNVAAFPLVKAGRLRALATTGERRFDAFPDVPTFKQAGSSFDAVGAWGFLASAEMPEPQAAALGDAIREAMKDPAVTDALLLQGILPEAGSAAQFAATLQRESQRWSKLIDEAAIKL